LPAFRIRNDLALQDLDRAPQKNVVPTFACSRTDLPIFFIKCELLNIKKRGKIYLSELLSQYSKIQLFSNSPVAALLDPTLDSGEPNRNSESNTKMGEMPLIRNFR
jgi:hypothetical protein